MLTIKSDSDEGEEVESHTVKLLDDTTFEARHDTHCTAYGLQQAACSGVSRRPESHAVQHVHVRASVEVRRALAVRLRSAGRRGVVMTGTARAHAGGPRMLDHLMRLR